MTLQLNLHKGACRLLHYSKENIPETLQTIIHLPTENSKQFQSFFTYLQNLQQEGKITYNENKTKALEPNPETFSNQNNNLNFSRGL
jgi:NADPH-dependent curcumin reductase CurA